MNTIKYYIFLVGLAVLMSCNNGSTDTQVTTPEAKENSFSYSPPKAYKDYWYNGAAEISSYALSQGRYGELRDGEAVLVFVTEPFSMEFNTKADSPTSEDPSVLKLNQTRNFTTGIYPYSMMNSTFFPVENGLYSLKASSSVQEWCGHVYMEMANKQDMDFTVNSYFQGETAKLSLTQTDLEDDIYSKIRLQPSLLKQGDFTMIPAFFYLRLKHVATKAYQVTASLAAYKDNTSEYRLNYPELGRTVSITFQTEFPHIIESWSETFSSGFGSNATAITTTAKRIKTIRSDYWRRNANADSVLRDSLGLK